MSKLDEIENETVGDVKDSLRNVMLIVFIIGLLFGFVVGHLL